MTTLLISLGLYLVILFIFIRFGKFLKEADEQMEKSFKEEKK